MSVIAQFLHCSFYSGWISLMGLVTLSSVGSMAVVVFLPQQGLTIL
jgi:hypothetical protein